RLNLTLWYSGVLAAALLLGGGAVYFGLQQLLMRPIETDLDAFVEQVQQQWQAAPELGCSLPGPDPVTPLPAPQRPEPGLPLILQSPVPLYLACFDERGTPYRVLLAPPQAGGNADALPSPFLSNSLVEAALRRGEATDIIDGGNGVGALYRYGLAVPDPAGSGTLGVVQVGRSVEVEQGALRTLRALLLGLGVVTLLGATGGGLFLAGRALAPARLAFARQQTFIADASHELRTPLTLLRADAEVLLRGRDRLPPEDAALLEDIVAETAHMSALMGDMLTLARLDADRAHLEHDVVDLAELVAEATRQVRALAGERGVALREEHGPAAPTVGDRELLARAALILLDNAVKYTPPGGAVTVRTDIVEGQARLTVCDTGIGIAAEHLPYLGERFYRVDKARSREAGGAGLGLAIARGIAAAHGGTLTLTSAPGRGTRATLALPAARVPAKGAAARVG
ncbi:MAG: ATP-binding protein, partial [Chloroflexota bacterium]|nr:ATP-binding protein [Chloroflexota bacterium]